MEMFSGDIVTYEPILLFEVKDKYAFEKCSCITY
jgi:hypothetical protein